MFDSLQGRIEIYVYTGGTMSVCNKCGVAKQLIERCPACQDSQLFPDALIAAPGDIQYLRVPNFKFTDEIFKQEITDLHHKLHTHISPLAPVSLQTEIEKNNLFICGGRILGALTGIPYNDIDLYVSSKALAVELEGHLLNQHSSYCSIQPGLMSRLCRDDRFITHLHITYSENRARSYKLNIIWNQNLESIDKILSNFDFTVCCVGYELATGILWKHPNWDTLIATSRLDFNNASRTYIQTEEFVKGYQSLMRILKYMRKGFIPDLHILTELSLVLQILPKHGIDIHKFLKDGFACEEYADF